MKLRDSFWIWGHKRNSLVGHYGFSKPQELEPSEGMTWAGAGNVWYCPMFLEWNQDDNCKMAEDAGAKTIGYSLEKPKEFPEHIDELLELAKRHPKLKAAILDDFFNPENAQGITPDDLQVIYDRLHNGECPLDLWMVYYTKNYGYENIQDSIDKVDGLTLWFWNEPDEQHMNEHIEHFLKMSEGKRRMIGCYLYDFGGSKETTGENVLMQLNKYRELLHKGLIEGVILHSNTVMDQGYSAPEAARKWLEEYGDEEIGTIGLYKTNKKRGERYV